jgi:hypothetical protein
MEQVKKWVYSLYINILLCNQTANSKPVPYWLSVSVLSPSSKVKNLLLHHNFGATTFSTKTLKIMTRSIHKYEALSITLCRISLCWVLSFAQFAEYRGYVIVTCGIFQSGKRHVSLLPEFPSAGFQLVSKAAFSRWLSLIMRPQNGD